MGELGGRTTSSSTSLAHKRRWWNRKVVVEKRMTPMELHLLEEEVLSPIWDMVEKVEQRAEEQYWRDEGLPVDEAYRRLRQHQGTSDVYVAGSDFSYFSDMLQVQKNDVTNAIVGRSTRSSIMCAWVPIDKVVGVK